MKALQITLLVTCAASLYSSQSTSKQSVNEGSFEEEINAGYDLLKDIPNEEGTVRFLKQLHNMEKELKNRLVQSAHVLPSEIMSYIGEKGSNIDPLDYTIEDVNHNNKVESALFQGDIILTKEQTEELMEDIKQDGSNRRKRQAFRDNMYPKTLWTNNQVYYSFSPNIFENATRAFKKAANIWSSATCIDFIESDTATDRILLIQGIGCYSALGKTGGVQPLSLGPRCERVGTAVHEIGHALGFFHTHSRHDRDSFIAVHPDNFQDGWLSQFTKISEGVNYNYQLTYDYGSVMHYGALRLAWICPSSDIIEGS
ncbi:Astacin (Peptidase M12A) [Parelaphostrongylus tenuis]|uniref:Metalloendopeptidase n=1 Tax=Parelaphostrongylus tenuis TaxID=148309 RepID=A0AAD5QLI0_PARTN|nr:Astacin (Peptidase M12A) [Parelaphostrongylus tenuis]